MPKLSAKDRAKLQTLGITEQTSLSLPELPDLDDRADPFAVAEEVPDPLAKVDYDGTTESISAQEMQGIEDAFANRSAQSVSQWMSDAFDSEYWVCFCFQTRAQKEEFLNKAKLIGLGDKYIDGRKAAKQLGFPVEADVCPQRPAKVDKRYLALVGK